MADDDPYNTNEDQPLGVAAPGVLGNDSDPDDDPLTAVLDTPPAAGVLDLHEDGSFSYSPEPDFCGQVSFSYHAYDGLAASNSAAVQIDVTCVNDAPTFTANDPPPVDEDAGPQTAVVAAGFNPGPANESGQSVAAFIVSNVANGSLLASGPAVDASGSLSFTPAPDAFGTVSFDLQVRDSGGTANGGVDTSTRQSVTITIRPVNDPPEISVDQESVAVDEGQTAVNSGTFSDIDSSSLTLSASAGTVTAGGGGGWSWSLATEDGPAQDQTVTITVDDGQDKSEIEFNLTVNNLAPTIADLIVPGGPVNINDQPLSVTVVFSDPGTADTHEVSWDWGDSTSDTRTAVSPATHGHTYARAGVYLLTVTVTDDDRGVAVRTHEFIVIYDPQGGFVTGGGWIMSPDGACPRCPASPPGKASFGFVSKYQKGATVPTGSTEFQFKAGDLNFRSVSYEWLVIAGANAKYKGQGTINGAGDYKFMLTATDGDLLGGGKPDEFRIRIWDETGLYYDNQIDLDQEAYGGTVLGGGSIVIHKAK